uniref:Uncharacterized protein n=2 Tax=Rhizophora mucronata TaxID=61149 RepID=A0A2P2L1S7_RHIMU
MIVPVCLVSLLHKFENMSKTVPWQGSFSFICPNVVLHIFHRCQCHNSCFRLLRRRCRCRLFLVAHCKENRFRVFDNRTPIRTRFPLLSE